MSQGIMQCRTISRFLRNNWRTTYYCRFLNIYICHSKAFARFLLEANNDIKLEKNRFNIVEFYMYMYFISVSLSRLMTFEFMQWLIQSSIFIAVPWKMVVVDWKIKSSRSKRIYKTADCPYHHRCVINVINKTTDCQFHLCVINVMNGHLVQCTKECTLYI